MSPDGLSIEIFYIIIMYIAFLNLLKIHLIACKQPMYRQQLALFVKIRKFHVVQTDFTQAYMCSLENYTILCKMKRVSLQIGTGLFRNLLQ